MTTEADLLQSAANVAYSLRILRPIKDATAVRIKSTPKKCSCPITVEATDSAGSVADLDLSFIAQISSAREPDRPLEYAFQYPGEKSVTLLSQSRIAMKHGQARFSIQIPCAGDYCLTVVPTNDAEHWCRGDVVPSFHVNGFNTEAASKRRQKLQADEQQDTQMVEAPSTLEDHEVPAITDSDISSTDTPNYSIPSPPASLASHLVPQVSVDPLHDLVVAGHVFATGFFTLSDFNAKEQIQSLPMSAKHALACIGVYVYKYKDGLAAGDKQQIGFIAQEVKRVFPQAVQKQGGFETVNYGMMVPVAVQAIKELTQDMAHMEERLYRMEQQHLQRMHKPSKKRKCFVSWKVVTLAVAFASMLVGASTMWVLWSSGQRWKSVTLPVIGDEPAVSSWFTGRDKELAALAMQLPGNSTDYQQVIVTSHRNFGAAQVVAKYAQVYKGRYDVVLWADARSEQLIRVAFGLLAQHLGATEQEALDWLHSRRWLLVLDDATEWSVLSSGIMKQVRQQSRVHTIAITYKDWQGLRIGAFPPEDAKQLLLARAQRDTTTPVDPTGAEALVKELEYVPGAIAQAADSLRRRHISIREYLHLYRTERHLLWREENAGQESVARTLLMEILALEADESPNAAEALNLMQFMSVFDVSTIPRELILRWLSKRNPDASMIANSMRCDTLVSILKDYLPVTFSDDTDRSFIVMNRQLQYVARERLRASNEFCSVLKLALEIADEQFDQYDVFDTKTWETISRMSAHAIQLTDRAQRYMNLCTANGTAFDSSRVASLVQHAGVFYSQRDPKEAVQLLRSALALTGNPMELAQLHSAMGDAYHMLGNYVKALVEHTEAITLLKPLLGRPIAEIHAAIAQSLTGLGCAHTGLGNFEKAVEHHQQARWQHQQIATESIHIARTLNNEAIAQSKQGNHTASIELLQQALTMERSICERERKPNHPLQAGTMNNLAHEHMALGKLDDAKRYAADALALKLAAGSESSLSLAESYMTLGEVCSKMDKHDEAFAAFLEANRIRATYFDDHHALVRVANAALEASRALGRTAENMATNKLSLWSRIPVISKVLNLFK